jgi:uncharacterized protein (DUF58 family)
MKKLLLALTFIAAGTFTYAQESNPNAPEITFEQETIDYGTVDKGSDGTREFVFKNTGKEPLIITRAVGSCGCTVPTWPREPIAPGEKGVMKVKYDTQRVGSFSKSVTVTSNASNSSKVLHIKGIVKAPKPVQTTPVKEEKTSMMQESK